MPKFDSDRDDVGDTDAAVDHDAAADPDAAAGPDTDPDSASEGSVDFPKNRSLLALPMPAFPKRWLLSPFLPQCNQMSIASSEGS
jgi:hypothetical protein